MRDLLVDRRQGDADGAADRVDGGAWRGAQPRPAAVLLDLDLAQVGEVVEDALPFNAGGVTRGEAVHQFLAQQQCEKRAEHMTADTGIGLVEDRPGRHECLGGFEGVLHRQQISVAQDHL